MDLVGCQAVLYVFDMTRVFETQRNESLDGNLSFLRPTPRDDFLLPEERRLPAAGRLAPGLYQ